MNYIQPSPTLLAAYISAASHQALSGEALSARSHWALEAAIEQIDAQRKSRPSAEADDWRGAAALAAAVEGRNNQLSTLALEFRIEDPEPGQPARGHAAELDLLVEDLGAVASERPDAEASIRRLSARFDSIVDSLLHPGATPVKAPSSGNGTD